MSLKGKSVLITGANGFIGKNLIKRLAKEEAEIYCIDKNQSELKELIKKEYIIDIKNFEELKKVISEINPNIIFHLAAFINHSRDINLIKETYEINVQGTINMLMATKDIKYDLFIYPNTSELYGDENETPFKENMNYCNLFLEVFNKPIAIFRMPVVYGPYQKGNMFIPSLINSIIKNKEFSMTKGEQHRDFIYVDDIMGAFIISCKKVIKGTFNLGSGKEIKLKEIAEYLQKSNNLTVKF
ncbi:SDR family NAD(P)-dependent oxidoreductase, partial [Candidatus Woesearchaeota archaeon]|nr:SDR family NAD(P)-dependent oxidoreductase [Candidatus Woesearchaeota archaeon]